MSRHLMDGRVAKPLQNEEKVGNFAQQRRTRPQRAKDYVERSVVSREKAVASRDLLGKEFCELP